MQFDFNTQADASQIAKGLIGILRLVFPDEHYDSASDWVFDNLKSVHTSGTLAVHAFGPTIVRMHNSTLGSRLIVSFATE